MKTKTMSKKSGKMKFWTMGFIISFTILILNMLLFVLLIINRVFVHISWINELYGIIRPWLLLIFYEYSIYIYSAIFIAYALLLIIFVLGYNLAKVKRMTGSIMYVFSLLGFVFVIFISVQYAYTSIIFNQDLILNTRFMLFILFLPFNITLILILLLVVTDFYVFLKDLRKARKVWNHKPEFTVEVKGNMTTIHIKTKEHIFTPIPMLIIAQYLQTQGFSVAWFVRGAFNHLISLIITYLTGWPRARNVLFRFIGIKVGENCHIAQNAKPDPLLPELIEFEDNSGVGIGVKLLTHDAMNLHHGSFSFGPIKVCKNARIGAYSVVLPGVTIGEGSIVGANSLVSEDIPPFTIAFGSPAKVVRKLTQEEIDIVSRKKFD